MSSNMYLNPYLSTLKRLMASTAFWASTSFLTILLFMVMLLITALTFPFDKKRRRQHSLCFRWSDAVICANPYWSVTVHGLEHIDCDRTCVIVANHQSHADIAILYQTRMQFKWIAKDSLFRIPFLGWCMSLTRHVRLRRDSLSSVRRAYQEAAVWIDKGVSVMFFPEGTRGESGEMQAFHNGAFKLALEKNVPVLPIAIQGAWSAMPKGKWVFIPDGHISMTVFPVLESDDFQSLGAESFKKAAWEMIHNAVES